MLKRRAVDAQKTTLLFAFGDSYADVGNTPKTGPNFGHAWVFPYGITWPGKPAGRFGDGKIQTDWLGKPSTRALVNRIAYENRNRVVQRLNITLFFTVVQRISSACLSTRPRISSPPARTRPME